MSRNFTTTLTATAVLALAGSAFGQSPVASYNAPNLDMVPTVSTQGAFNITVTGDADGDTITTSVQVFFIPGDGATGPTAIGGVILLDDGTGAGADGNAIDVDEDGTYGDALDDNDTDGFNVDLSLASNLATVQANITAARAAAGASGEVFLQFTFTDAGDDAQTTENPLTYDNATGMFTAGGTHESPVVLDGDLAITNAFNDADNDALILEFPVPIGPVGTMTNGTDATNVTAADLEIDDADDFAGAMAPSALLGGMPNGVIGGSDMQTLTFNFDPAVMNPDIPETGEFARVTGTDVEDSFGRLANADTDGSVISSLVEFAVSSVNWLQSVGPNGGNVADALAVEFTLPVDPTDPGDADFFQMIFMGEMIDTTVNNDATDLVQAGGFVITNIAVDTTVDPTGATVVIDVDSDSDSLGVAANGNNDDDDTATDIGTEDADTDGDETQKVFQLVTGAGMNGPGDEPASTLGTNYLGGADNSETNTIGDMISPTIMSVSFHDLDGDGTLDAIAGIADEALTDTTSTSGVTIQALDGAMVQPFAMIDGTTGALPDMIELEFDMDMDEEISVFTTSVGSVDPDLTSDGPSVLETNNALIFGGLDLTALGDNLPGTGDADIFDLAIDNMSGDFTDANGNSMNDLAATNADEDRAAPVLVMSRHLTSDNIPSGNLTNSNAQEFAEDAANGVGDSVDDRGVFTFSEPMGNFGAPGNVLVDDDLLTGASSFTDDALLTTPDLSNTVTVRDDGLNGMSMGTFSIPQNADLEDANDNDFIGSGTFTDGTMPFLPLATGGGWTAFLVDDDAVGEDGAGFADRCLIFLNGDIDGTLLDDPAEQTAQAAFFSIMGQTFTPESLTLSSGSMNILDLAFGAANDGLVSMSSTATIDYDGSMADPLLTGDAIDSTFDADQPSTPDVNTETPFVMNIVGNVTMNGQPAPIGTEIIGMIAVPTVRSISADKNGVSFRYDRSDIDQEEPFTDDGDNLIQRSIEDFTNFLLGLEEAMYLICDESNYEIYSNTKFFVEKNGDPLDDEDFGERGDSYDRLSVIDLDVNASNLDRISFSGRAGSGSATSSVSSGSVTLCYDVLRSGSGTFESLLDEGYCIDGDPITSNAIVTDTTGSYSLYVSMPNLEFSDSDDGISDDSNIFATANLVVVILVRTPDGTIFPASSLVNNVNGTGSILFSTEILSQTSDGEATGATTFNINLDNINNVMAYDGYNLVGFGRDSGFANSSNELPVFPDGITFNADGDAQNVAIGHSLLPSAGPEDQFVWWADDGDGVFESNEIDDIIVDNNCITSFPFGITSEGVQLGTNGVTAIVGGYSFGLFVDDTYGIAQFGAALAEAGFFTGADNEFPNSSANDGWAFVTCSQDFATMDDFFNANPDVDFVILFDRESNNEVTVQSASPAGGPTSGNDLTSLDSGDTIIIHTNN